MSATRRLVASLTCTAEFVREIIGVAVERLRLVSRNPPQSALNLTAFAARPHVML